MLVLRRRFAGTFAAGSGEASSNIGAPNPLSLWAAANPPKYPSDYENHDPEDYKALAGRIRLEGLQHFSKALKRFVEALRPGLEPAFALLLPIT